MRYYTADHVLCCNSHGDQDDIEAYVSPAMLQDPWAHLMKQYLGQQQQQASDAVAAHPVDRVNAGTGSSLSDAFEAVEQV